MKKQYLILFISLLISIILLMQTVSSEEISGKIILRGIDKTKAQSIAQLYQLEYPGGISKLTVLTADNKHVTKWIMNPASQMAVITYLSQDKLKIDGIKEFQSEKINVETKRETI
jgi:hypothetical protein